MSEPGKVPVGVTTAKLIGAVALVLVALAFGAGGACGAMVAVGSLWNMPWRTGQEYAGLGLIIGGSCAVVGLSAAGLLLWAVVALLRKKGDRDG